MAKNIAVALSGGGAKGGFQIGALHYIRQVHPEIWDNITIVAGVSVGALNASMLAMGNEGFTNALNLWQGIRKKDIMEGSSAWYNVLYRFLKSRKSIYSTKPLAKLVARNVDVGKIKKKLTIGVVDLVDGEYHKINPEHPQFLSMLVASASIPIILGPPVFGRYVDGGVRNVSPVSDVLNESPDKIIVINCGDPDLPKHGKKPKNVVDVAQRTLDIMMSEIFRNDLKFCETCGVETIMIEPTINMGETLDFDKDVLIERMKHGEARAKEILR